MGHPTTRRDRVRSDRGAALVEFALFLPLLLMILAAIVTGGVAFARAHSLDNSAREGARFGATLSIEGDLDAWLTSVADVTKNAATGDLTDGTSGREICVAYVYPDGGDANDQTKSILIDETGSASLSLKECFPDSRPSSERRVQVRVERSAQFNALFYQRDLTLTGESTARFERTS